MHASWLLISKPPTSIVWLQEWHSFFRFYPSNKILIMKYYTIRPVRLRLLVGSLLCGIVTLPSPINFSFALTHESYIRSPPLSQGLRVRQRGARMLVMFLRKLEFLTAKNSRPWWLIINIVRSVGSKFPTLGILRTITFFGPAKGTPLKVTAFTRVCC